MDEKKKILVVDDEKEMVAMLQMALEAKDYQVFVAFDGESALEAARKEMPDLVILDVVMPKKNGYQVCRTLKSHEETMHIPIIFLTARGTEDDRFWGREAGAEGYVVKPFEVPALLQKIEWTLEGL